MGGIRLFLACGVFLLHLDEGVLRHIGLPASSIWVLNLIGGRAVIFFYIVSGFLISHVLHTKYPENAIGTVAFYRSRFLRIYPLWWSFLFFCASASYAGASIHAAHLAAPALLLGSDWIVGFWHYPAPFWAAFPPGSEIGWTLGAEVAFYLAAPLVLRTPRLTLALFTCSALMRALVLLLVSPDEPSYKTWTYLFFPSVFVFFLLGHVAEKLHRARPLGLASSITLLIAAAAIASDLDGTTTVGAPLFHLAALCFAGALPGIFKATKDSGLSQFLGNLTYPLYLTHSVVIGALFSGKLYHIGQAIIAATAVLKAGQLKAMLVASSTLVIALGVAALVHLAIERPLRSLFACILGPAQREIANIFHATIGKSRLTSMVPPAVPPAHGG